MTIGSSSQNPRFAMERDQPATRLEVHESEESDARQSAHGNTRGRRSRSSSRKISQIQEVVLRWEDAAQRSQDTLDNMTAMMRWQAGIQGRQRGEALVVQEQEVPALAAGPTPVQAPQNQQELLPLHPEVPCNQSAAHLPEQQM
ncbi:unnamed protein product, partial [Prunus brigantina]